MSRANGKTLGVPVTYRCLGGGGFGETTVSTEGVHHPAELCRGGDIATDHPTWDELFPHRVDALPRRQHVQDGAIDRLVSDHLGQVTHRQIPGGVFPAEEVLDVPAGDVSELLPAFVGVQPAFGTDDA